MCGVPMPGPLRRMKYRKTTHANPHVPVGVFPNRLRRWNGIYSKVIKG